MIGRKKVAIALGGGGARGFAHIGVLEVLEENNLYPGLIAGTSMGAIIGGGYALLKNIKLLKNEILNLTRKKEIKNLEAFFNWNSAPNKKFFCKPASLFKSLYFWNSQAFRKGAMPTESVSDVIKELFHGSGFSETKIPFISISTDLKTGNKIIFREGPLAEAILASCAIPGFFPPVEMSGKTLVDGGVTSLVPVEEAKELNADIVIAVNVEKKLEPKEFRSGIDILIRMDEIKVHSINEENLSHADLIINPVFNDIQWYQFSKIEECILAGRKAAEENIHKIKKLFRLRWKIKKLWNFTKPHSSRPHF